MTTITLGQLSCALGRIPHLGDAAGAVWADNGSTLGVSQALNSHSGNEETPVPRQKISPNHKIMIIPNHKIMIIAGC
jgi:hypothetical protein